MFGRILSVVKGSGSFTSGKALGNGVTAAVYSPPLSIGRFACEETEGHNYHGKTRSPLDATFRWLIWATLCILVVFDFLTRTSRLLAKSTLLRLAPGHCLKHEVANLSRFRCCRCFFGTEKSKPLVKFHSPLWAWLANRSWLLWSHPREAILTPQSRQHLIMRSKTGARERQTKRLRHAFLPADPKTLAVRLHQNEACHVSAAVY